MSEIKLKPCPFCGGEMTVSGSSRLKRFTVSHRGLRECHFYAFEIDWQTVDSIAEAIEAWNKRAERHGYWKQATPFVDTIECSECGYQWPEPEFASNYCPDCGARMDEVVNE